MKRAYLNRINLIAFACVIISAILPVSSTYGQAPSPSVTQKAFFADSDPFRTAVFLENKGIVTPYKGEEVLYIRRT